MHACQWLRCNLCFSWRRMNNLVAMYIYIYVGDGWSWRSEPKQSDLEGVPALVRDRSTALANKRAS
jgi:hypothetical protein